MYTANRANADYKNQIQSKINICQERNDALVKDRETLEKNVTCLSS